MKSLAEQNGFCGGMTYSFESPKVFDKLLLAEDAKERQAIEISNPLGEDLQYHENSFLKRNVNISVYKL